MACLAALFVAAPASAQAPFAFGDSAANIPMNSGGTQVMIRWVPDHTGTISTIGLRVKVEGSAACPLGGRNGYASGTTGTLRATTYRVLADGRPDTSTALGSHELNPCSAQQSETVQVPLGIAVRAGEEYATVIQNVDSSPSSNYFSLNFLYIESGVPGANGRNERSYAATDTYLGLDPRELVGYSTNGGSSWRLPGGPYGSRTGGSFMPSYALVYSDGYEGGQPYYYAYGVSGTQAMRFTPRTALTVTGVGAYTSSTGSGTLTVELNGQTVASANVSGRGLLTAAIPTLNVPAGANLVVRSSGSLSLKQSRPDRVWADLFGLGSRYWYSTSSGDVNPVSIFPIYGGTLLPPPAAAPAPAPAAPAAEPLPLLVAPPVPRRLPLTPKAPKFRIKVVGRGAAEVHLVCRSNRKCHGRVLLTSPNGRYKLASRAIQLKAGGTKVIRLRLPASVLRKVAKNKRVVADLRCLGFGSWRHPVLLVRK